jgi:hypothetical protein
MKSIPVFPFLKAFLSALELVVIKPEFDLLTPMTSYLQSPFLRSFIATATSIPVNELLPYLSTFPIHWPFPRGDLYHWITLLNRFDTILEEQVQKYKLKEGPQTIPWEKSDEELVVGVLTFSRILVENCGNRSLYGSSGVRFLDNSFTLF